MSVRAVRWIVFAYLLVFLGFSAWPGAQLINRVEPLVMGLPFNLFFIAMLIIVALALLALLYVSEQRSGSD